MLRSTDDQRREILNVDADILDRALPFLDLVLLFVCQDLGGGLRLRVDRSRGQQESHLEVAKLPRVGRVLERQADRSLQRVSRRTLGGPRVAQSDVQVQEITGRCRVAGFARGTRRAFAPVEGLEGVALLQHQLAVRRRILKCDRRIHARMIRIGSHLGDFPVAG